MYLVVLTLKTYLLISFRPVIFLIIFYRRLQWCLIILRQQGFSTTDMPGTLVLELGLDNTIGTIVTYTATVKARTTALLMKLIDNVKTQPRDVAARLE